MSSLALFRGWSETTSSEKYFRNVNHTVAFQAVAFVGSHSIETFSFFMVVARVIRIWVCKALVNVVTFGTIANKTFYEGCIMKFQKFRNLNEN